jgi:hypothetical protein
MRWISTVALQANLQGEDGTGEGANGRGGAHLRVGGRPRLGEARTPASGGARPLGGARTPASGGARTPRGGAHACEWAARTPRGGRTRLRVGGRAHLRMGRRARL